MKRSLLLSVIIVFFAVSSSLADNRYWVGGSGSWNDEDHWSATSGGKGGAGVPTPADDVYFDANSFRTRGTEVNIHHDAFCRTFNWTGITGIAQLTGPSKSNLHISGSFILSPLVDLKYEGTVYFTPGAPENYISSAGKTFQGDIHFKGGNSSWTLKDDLRTSASSTIYLGSGIFNTAGFNVFCGTFNGSGVEKRSLKLGTSKVEVQKLWNIEESTNMELEAKSSEIIFHDLGHQNFRSGRGLFYGNLRAAGNGNQPAPLSHTVTTIVVPNPCNGDCIATATAVVTPAAGNYTYLWTPGNQTTQTATGLCAGTYLVVVTDVTTGDQAPAFATVVDPPPLVIFFSNSPASCNGVCNGSSSAIVAGGTPPYTYDWNPDPPNGDGTNSATGLCAGTYTLTIEDANNCLWTQTTTIIEPTVINPNGAFSNVTCNGFCDGTASVNPSGGIPPYSIVWTPGNIPGNSITNLCPGTYTANITDANNCTATYIATITQPPVLTLSVTQTNASCGGVCDGTASSFVAGGTPPYSYSWSSGQTTPNLTGLCAGSYTLTVTDANNCVVTQIVNITEPAILTSTPTGVNITCFNSCNGTASANAAGGTAPYTYSWSTSPVQTTAIATNLCPGTYSVTVTDNNGCVAAGSITISEPSLLAAGASATDATCNNLCNGTATSNPVGGTPPYTYSWSTAPAQTTQTITNLCDGNYTVIVVDSNGCQANQVVAVNEPLPLVPNVSKTDATCNGSCDGTATSNPTGGTGPYTFLWMPGGQTTQTATGLCAGAYTVTVTDANGCTTNSTVTITQPNPLTVSLNATQIACNTFCTSTISSNISGGTAPYSYSWAPGGQTTPILTNQCSGTYTLTVTDANGCIATASVTINQPTALNIVTTSNNATCNSTCNGSAAAITGGGTAPYSYSWAPGGQTTTSLTSLCAGSYTLTVTDNNGCQGTATITITEPQALLSNATSTNVSCNNACDGTATANPTGGTGPYTYQWMPGNLNTQTVTNLCAGNYTLTVTDVNNCSSQQVIQIIQPAPLTPVATALSSSCNICNGSGTVNVNGGTPPYSYVWSSGDSVQTATGLCPGGYTITVTDASGCVSTTTVTITQTVNIIITSSSSSLDCAGDCDGIATANASGGANPYSFLWSTNPIQFAATATNLCAGTYSVTATDANGCFNTATVTFTDPPVLTATMSSTNTSCNAACDGTATAAPAGGTGAYSYLWSNGQTTQTATGLCAGTYTVTINDVNACSYTDSVTVTQAPSIVANPTVIDANCNQSDGSITLSPSGGIAPYSFAWSSGPTTQNLTNIPAGLYTVTITDVAGCAGTFAIPVNNLNGPSLNITGTEVTCFGSCDGTSSVTVNGGTPPFTFLWSPGGQTTSSITALCEGGYNVQVTDGVGCITIATDSVTEPLPLSPNAIVVNASCGGVCDGSITTNISGGTGPYTYVWLPGGQTTPSISGLCAGAYTVTVTDNNGCDTTLTFNITEPAILDLAMSSSNVLCAGACNGTATATPIGGTAGYTFSWSHGPVLGNVVNLCPGTYTVIVTDANGCTANDTVNITEPPVLTSSVAVTNALCNLSCNGTATITGSGGTPGYTYSWLPGGQTTQTVNNLCAGTYNVTLTDNNGCTSSQVVNVTQPAQLVPGVTTTNATCNAACNGIAIANPSGGTGPYTYSWLPGGQTTQSITGLCAGNYTVIVTDVNGCTASQAVIITQPAVLLSNTSSTSPVCFGDCNGAVTATPSGGTSPYTYSWSPGGQTSQSVNNLCAGSYTVVVTDNNGCTATQTVAVTNPAQIDVVASVAPANCGTNNGSITITPITGTAPYNYTWNPPVAPPTSNTAANLGAGIYTVTVTDVDGCDSTFVITLNNSGGPTGATNATVDPLCNSSCSGISSITPIGGTAPYSYIWYDAAGSPIGQTNDTATSLCAGTYIIEITDANGCIFFTNDTINQPAPLISNGTVSQTLCSGMCNGSIMTVPSGGTGPYTFLWSGGQTTATISGLCAGNYSVTITDANNCTAVDSFSVTPSVVLLVNVASTSAGCGGACVGTASATVSSGTAPYTYLWNDPLAQTTANATGLCSGTYNLTVTDAVGCNVTQSTTINPGANITINPIVTNSACGQCTGQVDANATGAGALTYLWSNGQTTPVATGLCGGVYSLSITDSSGCSVNFQVPVNSSTAITAVDNVTNVSCFGSCDGSATVVPSGGTAPYTFLWVPGGQTTGAVSNLCAGLYLVQVADAAGCSYIDSVTIGSPVQISDNRAVVNATCGLSDGAITLNPSGGVGPYTYVWSPNVSSGSSATNLAANIYNVDITDANGCTQSVSIPINSQGGPSITVSATSVSCNGSCDGTADVDATGSSPFTYLWSNGQTTDSISGLCPGTYMVQVIDSAGCASAAQVAILQPPSLAFSLPFVIDETCPATCDGSATIIPSGGTMPYIYSWLPGGQTAPTATNICAGSHTVTVTDANGCSLTNIAVIASPPAITISNTPINTSCNNSNDGSIDVTVSGGTPPFTYQWSGASTATTEDLTNIFPGMYIITATDAGGCSMSDTIVITSTITVLADAGNDTTFCESGTLILNGSGSTNATFFEWYEHGTMALVGTSVTIGVTPSPGTTSYLLVATNGACSDTDTVIVTSNTPPLVDAGTDATILIFNSATLGGSPTGPAGSTFSWNPTTGLADSTGTNPIASPTATTTYTVTVTTANGCTATDTVRITVLPQIIFPNGISPNGDGSNDQWIIDNIQQFPNCVVEVYNRWGEMLFRSVGYNDPWDGTYKGKELPVGTYYYIINLNDPLYPDAFTGPITILR